MLVYLDETLDDAMARGNLPPAYGSKAGASKKLSDPKERLAYFKDNVQVHHFASHSMSAARLS